MLKLALIKPNSLHRNKVQKLILLEREHSAEVVQLSEPPSNSLT
jgi:hypothetical protein